MNQVARLEKPPDHWATLGVPPNSSDSVIEKAWRSAAKRFHPDSLDSDSATDAETFGRIAEAHRTLSDPRRRAEWELQCEAYHLQELEDQLAVHVLPREPERQPIRIKRRIAQVALLFCGVGILSFAGFIAGTVVIGLLALLVARQRHPEWVRRGLIAFVVGLALGTAWRPAGTAIELLAGLGLLTAWLVPPRPNQRPPRTRKRRRPAHRPSRAVLPLLEKAAASARRRLE